MVIIEAAGIKWSNTGIVLSFRNLIIPSGRKDLQSGNTDFTYSNSFYSKTFSQFFFDFSETLQISALHNLLQCCFFYRGPFNSKYFWWQNRHHHHHHQTVSSSLRWLPPVQLWGLSVAREGLAAGRVPGRAQGKGGLGGGLGCMGRGCPWAARAQRRWGPESESWARSSWALGSMLVDNYMKYRERVPGTELSSSSRPHSGFGTRIWGWYQPHEHRRRVTGPLFNPGNWLIIFLIIFVYLKMKINDERALNIPRLFIEQL